MIRPKLMALATALMVSAVACARSRQGGTSTALYGTDWRLAAIGQQPAVPSDVARRPWLRFIPDSNRVVGSGGCNRMNGPFTADAGSLRFGAIVSTKMACADEAMNRQEQDFFGVLQSTDSQEIVGDTLVLRRGDIDLARLVR